MANKAKYTMGEVSGLLRHFERWMDELGNYLKFSNQDIDISKTHLNYNLGPEREISQYQFIKQRCSEVDFVKRKNTNVMCSWVVTAPDGLATRIEEKKGQRLLFFEGEEAQKNLKLFFEESYKFLNDRYADGREVNVISAYVHMDETTPHMHYAFVPVVFDEARGRDKVSAKEAITKRDLWNFHKDFDKHMTLVYGRSIGVHNGITKGENLDKGQLRQKALGEQNAKLEAENARLQLEASNLQRAAFELSDVLNDLEAKQSEMRRVLSGLEGQIKIEGENLIEVEGRTRTQKGVLKIQENAKKSVFGDIIKLLEVDFNALINTALASPRATGELDAVKKQLNNLLPLVDEVKNLKSKMPTDEQLKILNRWSRVPDEQQERLYDLWYKKSYPDKYKAFIENQYKIRIVIPFAMKPNGKEILDRLDEKIKTFEQLEQVVNSVRHTNQHDKMVLEVIDEVNQEKSMQRQMQIQKPINYGYDR